MLYSQSKQIKEFQSKNYIVLNILNYRSPLNLA